jgi:hypothetical protein
MYAYDALRNFISPSQQLQLGEFIQCSRSWQPLGGLLEGFEFFFGISCGVEYAELLLQEL